MTISRLTLFGSFSEKYRGRRVKIQLSFPLCKTWFGVARTIDQPATQRAETSVKKIDLGSAGKFYRRVSVFHKQTGEHCRPCSMLPNYILPASVSGIILTHDSHFVYSLYFMSDFFLGTFVATSFPQRFHYITLEWMIILECEWWCLETMWLQCYSSFHFAGKN